MKFLKTLLFVATLTSIAPADTFSQMVEEKSSDTSFAVVQNRAVNKAGRFQIAGPGVGTSGRGDFYQNYYGALGVRYHFTENHGWEILRGLVNGYDENSSAVGIRQKTGLSPDSQTSTYSISTAYVFTPIYGKYAWNERSLVHFDIYATLGGGMRLASRDNQFFGEAGVGMNHYLGRHFSLVPEFRVRFYSEQRTESVMVGEFFAQLGLAWLL